VLTTILARDVQRGDTVILPEEGCRAEVIEVYHETTEGSKVETVRLHTVADAMDAYFVIRGWHEPLRVDREDGS
jgi:hypothetical protein